MPRTGFSLLGSVRCVGFKVQGSEFGVFGSGFRGWGLGGSRVQGNLKELVCRLGFRV